MPFHLGSALAGGTATGIAIAVVALGFALAPEGLHRSSGAIESASPSGAPPAMSREFPRAPRIDSDMSATFRRLEQMAEDLVRRSAAAATASSSAAPRATISKTEPASRAARLRTPPAPPIAATGPAVDFAPIDPELVSPDSGSSPQSGEPGALPARLQPPDAPGGRSGQGTPVLGGGRGVPPARALSGAAAQGAGNAAESTMTADELNALEQARINRRRKPL